MSATLEECNSWIQAFDEESQNHDDKNIWDIDNKPRSQPLCTHVVLKIMRNYDGSVERFKARMVACGNFQVFGENYIETYAAVVSFTAVRDFLYIAMHMNMFRA